MAPPTKKGVSSVRACLTGIQLEHKQVARGVLTVGAFVLLAKLIAMVKEMAVAWRYGTDPIVDAYLFVFNLIQYPANIWSGVIGVVLVPFAIRLRHIAPHDLATFRAELLGASIITAGVLGVVAWLVIPWLVQQPWIGLAVEQVALAIAIVAPAAAILAVSVLSAVWAAWTMAGNRHINTLLEATPALMILLGVLVLGGPNTLMWATLVGFVLQAVLLLLGVKARGDVELPSFVLSSPHWHSFLSGLGVLLLSQSLIGALGLVDHLFAARLGVGAISSLGYADRVLSLILTLGATTVGRALLPVLSRAHMQSKNGIGQIAFQWAFILGSIGLAVAIVGISLAPTGVEVLFQRGRFTAEDTRQVAEVLRYSLVRVPFYFTSLVLVYALFSQGRQRVVAVVTALGVMVKFLLALVLVPVLGLGGLVLATAGVYLTTSASYAWLLHMDDASLNRRPSSDR